MRSRPATVTGAHRQVLHVGGGHGKGAGKVSLHWHSVYCGSKVSSKHVSTLVPTPWCCLSLSVLGRHFQPGTPGS